MNEGLQERLSRIWLAIALDYPCGALVYVLGGWRLVALWATTALVLSVGMLFWLGWREANER